MAATFRQLNELHKVSKELLESFQQRGILDLLPEELAALHKALAALVPGQPGEYAAQLEDGE